MKLKDTPWKESYAQPREHIKKQRHYFANKGLSSHYDFSSSHIWMWQLDHKESWALKNWCFWIVVLEKTLGLQRDPTSQSKRKSVLNIHWKDWCWSWNSNTLATWCEELTHWKRSWCWERLKAGGEGDNRGWDGWMALLTWWTWVWASSGSWWWTGRPGLLQSMGLQRVGHDWVTEPNWFIYRAVSGLSCGLWGLHRIVLDFHVWYPGLVAVVCGLSCFIACETSVPWPGIEPVSPLLQGGFFFVCFLYF